MSGDAATTDLLVEQSETEFSSSGSWSKSNVDSQENTWKSSRLAPIAGMLLAIAATAPTAIYDIWLWDRRRRDASSVSLVFGNVIGRSISRTEALRIVRQIIERAEQERIQLAELEAVRGIQWEEDR